MDLHDNAWDWSVLGLSSPPLTENVLDFSSPIQPSFVGFEELNSSHGKSDVFAEWMDEKIDLSILDGLEGQPDILDDLDVMVGDPAALLDNLMDWSSELLGNGSDINNINTKKIGPLEEDMLQIAGQSPPVSPGNNVPDISFAVLPEVKQESLYRQTSYMDSPPVTTTVIPDAKEVEVDDDFDPIDYLRIEYNNSIKAELDSPISSSPPLTPVSLLSNTNEYLKVDDHISDNTEVDSCVSSAPPVSPVSFASTVEFIATENDVNVETVSVEMPHLCDSLILDSPFNCKTSDNESNEMSDATVKEYNSGNTSLLETGTKSHSHARKRYRKKAVSTSDPPVPVEVRRKERKRVQNKDAATRYREKKRKEGQAVMDEQTVLEKRNKELHNTVDKLSNEISYLKGLLKEAKLRAQSRHKMLSNFKSPITV